MADLTGFRNLLGLIIQKIIKLKNARSRDFVDAYRKLGIMHQNMEIKGYWFDPDKKDNKISGILKITDEGITLSTIDKISDKHSNKIHYEILIGETNEGFITLINSFIISSKYYYSGNKVPYEIFSVDHCLIGKSFSSINDIKFPVFAFAFEGLDLWASVHGFKKILYDFKDNKKGKKYIIDYKQPLPIRLYKNDSIELLLYFSVTQKLTGIFNRIGEISEKTYLNLYSKRPLDFFDSIKLISSLKTLHKLAISSASKVNELTFWTKKTNGEKVRYYSSEILGKSPKMSFAQDILRLSKEDLKKIAPSIFKNWFEKYEKLEPVYELYYNAIYIDKRYGRTEFLNLVFALETMHRRLIGGESITLEEYKKSLEKIKSVLSDSEQKALLNKMNYLYQYSLRTRLKFLVDKFEFVVKLYKEKRSDFVDRVVSTRNYYVHLDESSKDKIVNEKQFPYYNHILRLLLDSFLLTELGLSNQQLDKFIKGQFIKYSFIKNQHL